MGNNRTTIGEKVKKKAGFNVRRALISPRVAFFRSPQIIGVSFGMG
jgi:hypothetical protein